MKSRQKSCLILYILEINHLWCGVRNFALIKVDINHDSGAIEQSPPDVHSGAKPRVGEMLALHFAWHD